LVLWLRILEPYVPLRNATKRKRLRIGYICRNHSMIYMAGVNSNTSVVKIKNCKKYVDELTLVCYIK
jgi:hypothetical protein